MIDGNLLVLEGLFDILHEQEMIRDDSAISIVEIVAEKV